MVSPILGPKTPFSDTSINTAAAVPALPSVPSIAISPSRYPIAADSYYSSGGTALPSPPFTSESGSLLSHSPKAEETFPGSDSLNTYPLYNWSYKPHHSAASIPPLSYYYRPHRLEEIAPRDTIYLIIALFFDFVYPLTPCVHKPSFMADLHARREERDPLFFALVMSTVASTLVQVPRSYLPLERPVVHKMAQVSHCGLSSPFYELIPFKTCHEASRHISVASYDPPTSMHVVIRYLYVSVLNIITRN